MDNPAMFDNVKFYGAAVVSEKGQVIIPAEVRKRFGINAGDRLLVTGAEKWARGVFFSQSLRSSQKWCHKWFEACLARNSIKCWLPAKLRRAFPKSRKRQRKKPKRAFQRPATGE